MAYTKKVKEEIAKSWGMKVSEVDWRYVHGLKSFYEGYLDFVVGKKLSNQKKNKKIIRRNKQ
jgi:sulfur relay (sulfurtransferase) DsrC/TusE family protein